MDNKSGVVKRDDHIELPPGFRFHPTDEELIIHYLLCKVVDPSFSAIAIGEVDMNRVEPWELPWRGKLGEKEWYFFCVRDKKYPSGQRTNRATAAGYWKATGKDKEIFRKKKLVGMKKTLVFYRGRAPKGERSNWVAHEYRLEGEFSLDKLPNSSKNDCVIIRVFKKTSGGQKIHISGLMRTNSEGNRLDSSTMPHTKPELEPGHVHCFSRPVTVQDNPIITCFNNPIFPAASHPVNTFPGDSFSRFPGLIPFQDSAISRTLTENYDQNIINQGFKTERDIVTVSQETDNSCVVSNLEIGKRSFEENGALPTSTGSLDFDCIWSY